MEKLLQNSYAYLEYLRRECHLFCSLHFSEDSWTRISAKKLALLAPYLLHSHPYCHFVKANGHHPLCMQNQKDIISELSGKDFLLHTCHSGVCEIIYPVRCEARCIRGFVAVSGYRTADSLSKTVYDAPLFFSLTEGEPPRALTDTLIPPLCLMLAHLIEGEAEEAGGEFHRILSYLAENHTHLTLDALAAHFGRSRSHISHLFKTNTGLSLRAYCNDLRLTDARLLLQSTELSVTEIAYEVGFEDASYFIKLFREKYGTSPRKFREIR